jgi:hypothetical protein
LWPTPDKLFYRQVDHVGHCAVRADFADDEKLGATLRTLMVVHHPPRTRGDTMTPDLAALRDILSALPLEAKVELANHLFIEITKERLSQPLSREEAEELTRRAT